MYLKTSLNPNQKIIGTDESVLAFWQWAYSNILTNATRGIFAEYLVGLALGLTVMPRQEWDSVDFRYKSKAVEVKSSSYLQSWEQNNLSKIIFDIAERNLEDSKTRFADIYVFCVYNNQLSKDVKEILDIGNWDFYILPKLEIDNKFKNQKSLSLSSLENITSKVTFSQIKKEIEKYINE